jgi:hypothetical protein
MNIVGVLTLIILNSAIVFSQEVNESSLFKNSIGIGAGIPYGGLVGLNGELMIVKNLNATVGIGLAERIAGYNVGAKYYLRDGEKALRPRISGYYGVNGTLEMSGGSKGDETKTYSGLSIGIGLQWMWGESLKHGLDVDLIYLALSVLAGDVDRESISPDLKNNNGEIRFSIGYRFGF